MPKMVPKSILEGTRLTYKTGYGLRAQRAAAQHGSTQYRYHSPLILAEWCTFTNLPWGRGMINFEPGEEALAMETYKTWVRLFELPR